MDGAFHCAVVLQFVSPTSQSPPYARSTTLATRRSSVYVAKCVAVRQKKSLFATHRKIDFTFTMPRRQLFRPRSTEGYAVPSPPAAVICARVGAILSKFFVPNHVITKSRFTPSCKKWGVAHNYYLRLFNMRAVIMRCTRREVRKIPISLSVKCQLMRVLMVT